jgi:uncharacterized linocin/CFP29 family protein
MEGLDFILNGAAHGSVATKLLASNFNPNALRPFIGKDNRTYMSLIRNGKLEAVPVNNAPATLRKEDWLLLDEAVLKAAQPRLKLVGDLRARGLQYTIPNGMGTTVFQTETMSDINDATISMDGLRQGANDRPVFDLTNLPLPIIHKDFSISARQLAASRNGGSPFDTSMAELASRKVAEMIEKLAIGSLATYNFGGGIIYGLTNRLGRLTQVLTSPASTGWVPKTLVTEVLEMMKTSQDSYHYGPWVLYIGTGWNQYMGEDYKDESDITLRERLLKLEGLEDVVTLDYLSGYQMVLLEMTTEVIREIIGMDVTSVQWETNGGMLLNYKVMAIMVPQLRLDSNSHTGIVHGNVA